MQHPSSNIHNDGRQASNSVCTPKSIAKTEILLTPEELE